MDIQSIQFDRELDRGLASYNDVLGEWWQSQSLNAAHLYAYRTIADFIRESVPGNPQVVVDYACGPGHLLTRLSQRFPEAQVIGLDGSAYLLEAARRRLRRAGRRSAEKVVLRETPLPDFTLPRGIADLVVFAFPNIVPAPGTPGSDGYMSAEEIEAARALSANKLDPDEDPRETCEVLMRDRMVAANMRHLLKPGGLCIRIEYSNVPRDELSRLEILRTGYEEGSLDQPVDGRTARQWFRIAACRYFRSGVMEDVYHQSGHSRTRKGGYFITVMRAL